MRPEDTELTCRWQPLLVMLRVGGRLECKCGALAVIMIGELTDKSKDEQVEGVDYWCQQCYLSTQQEETA